VRGWGFYFPPRARQGGHRNSKYVAGFTDENSARSKHGKCGHAVTRPRGTTGFARESSRSVDRPEQAQATATGVLSRYVIAFQIGPSVDSCAFDAAFPFSCFSPRLHVPRRTKRCFHTLSTVHKGFFTVFVTRDWKRFTGSRRDRFFVFCRF